MAKISQRLHMLCTELVLSPKDAPEGHFSYDHQCWDYDVSTSLSLEVYALTSKDQAGGIVRWRMHMLYACYPPDVQKEPREEQCSYPQSLQRK